MRPSPVLLSLALLSGLRAQQPPMSVPVAVAAEVDTKLLPVSGRALLKLRFTPEVAVETVLLVRVELHVRGRRVLRRDHAPPVPTRQWRKDTAVAYELPLVLGDETAPAKPGDEVQVLLAFVDPADDRQSPPLSSAARRDGLAPIATFTMPPAAPVPDAAGVAAAITAAQALAGSDPAAAWASLAHTFRRLEDYRLKREIQQALLQVGRATPAQLSFEEQDIVQARIAGERARWLRLVAGRLFDRGMLHGALVLLDEVGGSLQEQADRAVLGSLDDARRASQDRESIAAKVFAATAEQLAEVELLAGKHAGLERIAVAEKLAKTKAQRAVARELVRTLEFTPEHRAAGEAARAAIEKAWLADVPPEQRAAVDEALQHPCWARTTTRPSHHFVLIGPQALLAGIPADSLLRFDLAYLYVTDLFGRVPNPEGDRVTVYWKELWDFGGGVGGGKIIDIGNADPAAKATRVDNGLLYHELTHCVDDTNPIYDGFREGLADFGAIFAQHELGQVAGARAGMGLCQRAFLADYLERDLEYWRIPNYAPSAGFLLHFVQQYGKEGESYRWDRYRRFFRDYRNCPVKDARAPSIARAFAYHLGQAFGEQVFVDLQKFRWPLVPSDVQATKLEQEAARRPLTAGALDELPNSPVPRDREAKGLQGRGSADAHSAKLGVIRDWWVIGPFRHEGADPGTFRFPPEAEIDLKARYATENHNPTWRKPGPKPATIDRAGWVAFDFQYMDDTAFYAVTHVTWERETEAWLHVRADDDLSVFVGDVLIGAFSHDNGRVGPWRPDREVMLPDSIRFRVTFPAGRTKLLLKVRNRRGPCGFSLAIGLRNGLPLEGWSTDTEPPARKPSGVELADARKWPQRFRSRYDAGGAKKLEVAVGEFRVRNGAYEGTATDKEVEWRKYTVRPGFPKDSPSNLAWLPEKATEHADTFWLGVDLWSDGPPKLCTIVQGEGNRDALCGWTLILEPHGETVQAHLERYDLRLYSSARVPWKPEEKKPVRLELQHQDRRLTVRLGPQVLFDQAPLQTIPGRHRIGFATWGPSVRFAEIELRGPGRTKGS